MGFRSFLILMGIATLLAWVAWGFVLTRVNPIEAGVLGLFLFYLTLFAGSIGVFFFVGLGYRYWIHRDQAFLPREVQVAFRQAILIAVVGIFGLALSAAGKWSWGIFLFLILLACGVEYAFMMVQSSRR
jgi:hypothetical protein